MKLIPLKRFTKAYRKLPPRLQDKVDETLVLFERDPFHPELRNHPLRGRLDGMRAISAGFDLRILYSEKEDHVIVHLLDVGTHNQVY